MPLPVIVANTGDTGAGDTGILCLVALCRFHQLAVDAEHLAREFGAALDNTGIQRAAKVLGLRCKQVGAPFMAPGRKQGAINHAPTLPDKTPLPAIAKHRDGSYFILARQQDDKILLHDLREPQPRVISKTDFTDCWSGELLLFSRRRQFRESLQQQFDIRWFIPALHKYRKLFGEVIVASFFLQVFALLTPLFFQVVMDKVLVHHSLATLDVFATGFLIVVIFESVLGGIRSYVFSHTSNRVDVELGAMLYRHLLNLPLAYFQSRAVGQSVARLRELDSIRNFITGSALTLLLDLSFTVIFFAVMLYYSVSLSAVVMLTIPAYSLLALLVNPLLRQRLEDKFRYSAQNQSFLVESVSGMETVKSLALEPQMQRDWEERLANTVSSSFRAQHIGNIAAQSAGLINKLMTLGILWWGAQLVMRGELSVGQLVAFNMLAGRISGPILKLVQLVQDFQQAQLSVDRLGDILNTPCESAFNPDRSSLPTLQGSVSFERVRFRYRPDMPLVLDELDLQVAAGEIIGIVGKSGSGKSTLAKLVQRLYVPEAGRVLVDGVDLATVDCGWLRRNLGVVLQDSFLFNRSVRDNIAVSNPALPMPAVMRAAQQAGAHEFIAALPQAYDTIVEEHGANLSGGQRQRIAIARALVSQPRILVFDEATSALDVESEQIIQRNMTDICKDRTVFIIAHRLSTVRGCDRIIVLDRGRIIEQGRHEQLLAHNGYYAQLHRQQNEEVILRKRAR